MKETLETWIGIVGSTSETGSITKVKPFSGHLSLQPFFAEQGGEFKERLGVRMAK